MVCNYHNFIRMWRLFFFFQSNQKCNLDSNGFIHFHIIDIAALRMSWISFTPLILLDKDIFTYFFISQCYLTVKKNNARCLWSHSLRSIWPLRSSNSGVTQLTASKIRNLCYYKPVNLHNSARLARLDEYFFSILQANLKTLAPPM